MDVNHRTQVLGKLKSNEVDFAFVSVLPENIEVVNEPILKNALYLVGPTPELEAERPFAVDLVDDLRSGHVRGHQIRRELDARELEPHRRAQRSDQQRLTQARQAFEEHVATSQQGRDEFVDQLVLTEHLRVQHRTQGVHAFDQLERLPFESVVGQ